jgi:hypothetical protein
MSEILHETLPDDLLRDAHLPGIRPLTDGRWLRVDEAYKGQVAYRRALIAEQREKVLWEPPEAQAAIAELFDAATKLLPEMGFDDDGKRIRCPDGHSVGVDSDTPLAVLGQILQQDLCLMEKSGDEHVLTAAVLCFPANWRLADKAGRPLTRIHDPVKEYDAQMAKRVQRLFDGVQVGRPIWRNNMLRYANPDLHQPTRMPGVGPMDGERFGYIRAERQCILRLPKTGAVVFSIHSYVVRAEA